MSQWIERILSRFGDLDRLWVACDLGRLAGRTFAGRATQSGFEVALPKTCSVLLRRV